MIGRLFDSLGKEIVSNRPPDYGLGHNDAIRAAGGAATFSVPLSMLMRTPCRVATTRMRPKGHVMAKHKFRAGQKVTLIASFPNRSAVGGGYVVTRQLPERDGEFEYRIKNLSDSHERVAPRANLLVNSRSAGLVRGLVATATKRNVCRKEP